jgi:superfamily I DNA and/or RNA helicase
LEAALKYKITELLDEINTVSSNDILVNVLENKTKNTEISGFEEEFVLELEPELKNILSKNEAIFKDSGVSPICLCEGTLEWEYQSKIVSSPLFLLPLHYRKNKVKNCIHFQIQRAEIFINPFLKNHFKKNLDIEIPPMSSLEEIEEWIREIEFNASLTKKSFIGNFHHHRFQIVRDLEGILQTEEINSNVLQILGQYSPEIPIHFPLSKSNLFPADNDQLSVFSTVQLENSVIQGPPGTGKSQVLSNLLGKILYNSSNVLVVSEKRVALDVLQKKLAHFKLDEFSFISTSETNSSDFISSLKGVWDRMEKKISSKKTNLYLSENLINSLQSQLNLLQNTELIGGVSYDDFSLLSREIDFSKAPYTSDFPTIKEWQTDLSILEKIYALHLHQVLRFLPFEVIRNEQFETIDLKVAEWKKGLSEVQKHFDIKTIDDVSIAMKKAAICQVFENETSKKYFTLLNPLSKERKKYNQLKKKYHSIQNQLLGIKNEILNWKIEPSENECTNLLESLKSGSYFVKRKAKKRISQIIASPFVEVISALENRIKFIQKEKELHQIQLELNGIGLYSPASDILYLDTILFQIDQKEWEIYSDMTSEERKKICEFHSLLNQLNSTFKTYFQFEKNQVIHPFLEQFKEQFESLIRLRSEIKDMHISSYRLLGKAENPAAYARIVFKSNWVKFESHFPEFAKFQPQQLYEKIAKIIELQTEESQLFSEQIEEQIHAKFKNYHQLLQTPSAKLTAEQKEKKHMLRKGKSLLVKEFSKSRSHPSIRELLQTEAAIWIRLLKPIWLSNPSQVARCFPLEKSLFDFVLFDEASQIPLSNSLGSLQRGKRIIVAGDEQQMSPTSYFQAGISETIDLLHQASYYWKNIHLHHHYRSDHPELIAFSNTHFYNNSLIAYPSGSSIAHPIQLHRCENGIYEERTNIEEARLVVKIIEENLNQKHSLGIVAFSESQLKCIWDQMSPSIQQQITRKIENGEAYFKALENVQGDECDRLIVSLGYSKNAKGEFKMQFGPLNQKSGSKRLNVLFTRAKKSIDFISSVGSIDFKISENESINLLRIFLQTQEEKNKNTQPEITKDTCTFPYGLKPEIKQTKTMRELQFSSIYSTLKDANELITFQRVLENREWQISYKTR